LAICGDQFPLAIGWENCFEAKILIFVPMVAIKSVLPMSCTPLVGGPRQSYFFLIFQRAWHQRLWHFYPFFTPRAVAGLAALLGHCLPVFIGFKGGRGVLTGSGVVLVLSPITYLIDAITTFSTIGITRYVSLGSIVGGLTTMICGII